MCNRGGGGNRILITCTAAAILVSMETAVREITKLIDKVQFTDVMSRNIILTRIRIKTEAENFDPVTLLMHITD